MVRHATLPPLPLCTRTSYVYSSHLFAMKWSSPAFLVASLHLAAAHGDDGYFGPRLFGARKFWSEMRARRGTGFTAPPAVEHVRHGPQAQPEPLGRRQNSDGQCGPGVGSCAAGSCCSPEGWCGTTSDYCSSPDCQINYGTGCDAVGKHGALPPAGQAGSALPLTVSCRTRSRPASTPRPSRGPSSGLWPTAGRASTTA